MINRLPYSSEDASNELLAELAEQLAARLAAGDVEGADALLELHPDRAVELRQLLPAARMMADLGRDEATQPESVPPTQTRAGSHDPLGGTLGDFRLIRQVGRGGMGIVYEAEQISLRRRVALKVLPMAGLLDDRQVQRFRNEASAAAGLHHHNIVPVYSVGCERGVHYLAMQFIEGRTLAEAVQEARVEAGLEPVVTPMVSLEKDSDLSESEPFRSGSFTTGPLGSDPLATTAANGANSPLYDRQLNQASRSPAPGAETVPVARLSTARSHPDKGRYRTVARLIQHAAEALDYAHSMGVVHRDVKPSNLLLDTRGNVWVADFGLAHLEGNASLTMTGDVLGTLRYMSPEQATGRRDLVDHRSDIYSLGLTLYELLTLQPAFAGETRGAVLRQMIEEEPTAPRRLNPSIPADLETVLLKAAAKEPASRYQTAREFAEDLRRFVADEPIRAKRPGLVDRAFKWSRRHRAVTLSVLAVMLITTTISFASAAMIAGAYEQESAQRQVAEQAADREVAQRQAAEADYLLARQAVERMLTQVAEGPLAADFAFRESRRGLLQDAEALYSELLKNHPEDASLFLARAKVRELLGDYVAAIADGENAVELSPDDVEILNWLGHTFAWPGDRRLRDLDLAISYFEHAVALAPDHTLCRVALSAALDTANRKAEASQQLEEAQRRDPKNVLVPIARAQMLSRRGEWVSARAEAEAAVRLAPQAHKPHWELANILHRLGHHEAALAKLDEAIRLEGQPGCNKANALHSQRGDILFALGRDEEALTEFDRGIELAPYWSYTYKRRAACRFRMGRYDEALADLQRALELLPDDPSPLIWIPVADVRRCPSPSFRERLLQLADVATQRDGASAETWGFAGELWAGLIGPAEGRDNFARAIREGVERPITYYHHAIACLSVGDRPAYRKTGADMIERFRQADSAEATSWTAWSVALASEAVDDFQPVIMLAQRAAEAQPDDADAVKNYGAILYRAGRFAESAERLEAADRMLVDSPAYRAYARFLLAMAYHRMGDGHAARIWFDKAAEWTDATLADPQRQVDAQISWNRRVTLELLRAEAEALLGESDAESPDGESQRGEPSPDD